MEYRTRWISITSACNLHCSYCYQRVIGFDKRDTIVMDERTVFDIISYIAVLDKDADGIFINMFGGEPLLNFEVIKKAVLFAHSKIGPKCKFALTTNGTLLNSEITNFLIDNRVSVLCSIDGKKDTHDQARKFSNGKGSFDLVLQNFRYLLDYSHQHNEKVSAAMTVTPESVDLLFENAKYLSELGFDKIFFNLEFQLTDDLYGHSPNIDPNQLYLLYEDMRAKIQQGKWTLYDNLMRFTVDVFWYRKNVYKSNAKLCSQEEPERLNYTFTSTGAIYPCHYLYEMHHQPKSIGNIYSITPNELLTLVNKLSLPSVPDELEQKIDLCYSCFYNSLCYKGIFVKKIPGCFFSHCMVEKAVGKRNTTSCLLQTYYDIALRLVEEFETDQEFLDIMLKGAQLKGGGN